MANTQLIIGAAVGVGVALVLVAVFSGEEGAGSHGSPAQVEGSARSGAAGEGDIDVSRPSPTIGTPRAGTNPALARLNAAGGVKLVPKESGRSKLMEAADGFAHAAPSMSGPAPVKERPSEAGDVVRPGRTWPIDREGIRGAVQESVPEMRECYEAWLQQNPSIGGRVVVTFTIQAIEGEEKAKVVGAKLADQGLGHVAMEGCIVNVFEGLRFERPADGKIDVTYPLNFSNGEKDAGSP